MADDTPTSEFDWTDFFELAQELGQRVAALPQRQAKSALRSGRSLLHARKEADYHLLTSEWQRRTETALHDAQRALQSLADLLG